MKHKILFISDHPLCTSGVGIQARMLIEGLLRTGKYTFRCLGGAIRHENYDTIAVNSDFIIKPVDGFGTKEMVRQILITERPDAIIIFTDPRQFIWLWEMEDEIHQVCPIAYWHVWDNDPYPKFNEVWYESTDLINCLSYKTYEMLKPKFPEKTNYIPHSFPKDIYKPLPKDTVKKLREQHFGDKSDWQIGLWVNRNATRKMPGDVIESFKKHLDNLQEKYGHKKSLLIMHTDPLDIEGPNLFAITEALGVQENVWFSTQKLSFSEMNILHNITDYVVNVSKAEGFGLTTLISLMVGKPIIALKTGGLTRQVVDWRDGTVHGVAIEPAVRTLVGSQLVPYIYDDHVNKEELTKAFMKLYEMTPEEKEILAKKEIEYADFEFSFDKMIKDWDFTLSQCIANFKENKNRQWSFEKINIVSKNNQNISMTQVTSRVSPSVEETKSKIDLDAIISMKTNKPKIKNDLDIIASIKTNKPKVK
jgi:glycosyltransferase involved in cell wall biosynthesis